VVAELDKCIDKVRHCRNIGTLLRRAQVKASLSVVHYDETFIALFNFPQNRMRMVKIRDVARESHDKTFQVLPIKRPRAHQGTNSYHGDYGEK